MDISDNNETVIFDLDGIEDSTEKAIQVTFHDGENYSTNWIPKSLCRIVNNKIYIAKWFAEKEGLI